MKLAAPWQPKRWSWAEYDALPEAGKHGGCPCGALHYGCVNISDREMPPIYRCHGTEWPNADDAPGQLSCGGLFRGRPGEHYNEEWLAAVCVGIFLTRGRSRTTTHPPERAAQSAALPKDFPGGASVGDTKP